MTRPTLLALLPHTRTDRACSGPSVPDEHDRCPGSAPIGVAIFEHVRRVLRIPKEVVRCSIRGRDAARSLARRQERRAAAGKPVEAGSGATGSWALESLVCDRVARQVRLVGDALAWRLFNFDRRVVMALSRNDPGAFYDDKRLALSERSMRSSTRGRPSRPTNLRPNEPTPTTERRSKCRGILESRAVS